LWGLSAGMALPCSRNVIGLDFSTPFSPFL
jgi:hypothetical protein